MAAALEMFICIVKDRYSGEKSPILFPGAKMNHPAPFYKKGRMIARIRGKNDEKTALNFSRLK